MYRHKSLLGSYFLNKGGLWTAALEEVLLLGVRFYAISMVVVMNVTVFSNYCLQPQSLFVSRVSVGHTSCLSVW